MALSHPRLFSLLRRLPYRQLHFLVRSTARAETWLRWPLRTLRMLDWVDDTMRRVDPDGTRFGLTNEARRRFRQNLLYDGIADLAVLITRIGDPAFRRRALAVEGRDTLERERDRGPGTIVLGFRLGAYPVIPLALSALGNDVFMIVGAEGMIRIARGLGERFAPVANAGIQYMAAQDPSVLARSLETLNGGGIVSTLMDLSPIKYAKTTEVRFLDWHIQVPYGIPYLAAMTGRSIIPCVMVRDDGTRFRLRFLDAVPAPARERASVLATTQELYRVLEAEVRQNPDQWAGWTMLESHLGVDLGRKVASHVPAVL